MEHLPSRPRRLVDVHNMRIQHPPSLSTPYAILSHTWSLEEVSFHDWQKHNVTRRQGYQKVLGACMQARKDGIDYLWADTCCIDKRDSSELSEAINSMYAWYAQAEVCYTYLADVEPQLPTVDVVGQRRVAVDARSFCKSKWWTRGWTLQELIAPKRLVFFAQDWTVLGTLDDLLPAVVDRTGIPYAVLMHEKSLAECSVAQRLSWASKRETSRPEDIAYCLLGILEMNLDLRYGEGPKAFFRLQEESLLRTGDLSALAWGRAEKSASTALLATSPKAFEHCGQIDNVTEFSGMSEHWMTSNGLKGTFPVITDRKHEKSASPDSALLSLNCCDSSDRTRVLALSVAGATHSQDTSSIFFSVGPSKRDGRLSTTTVAKVRAARSMQATLLLRGRPSPRTSIWMLLLVRVSSLLMRVFALLNMLWQVPDVLWQATLVSTRLVRSHPNLSFVTAAIMAMVWSTRSVSKREGDTGFARSLETTGSIVRVGCPDHIPAFLLPLGIAMVLLKVMSYSWQAGLFSWPGIRLRTVVLCCGATMLVCWVCERGPDGMMEDLQRYRVMWVQEYRRYSAELKRARKPDRRSQ